MRIVPLVLLMTLLGCHSSVGLCGDEPVCGSDGLTYEDRCAALSAGADVLAQGACDPGCGPTPACLCAHTIVDGCPVCDCPDGDIIDADTPDARDDSGIDGGTPDAVPTDVGTDIGTADVRPDAGCAVTEVDCMGVCVGADAPDLCSRCGVMCDVSSPDLSCELPPGAPLPECVRCAPEHLTECGDVCADLEYDRSHCDECGRVCGRGEVCEESVCIEVGSDCRSVEYDPMGTVACSAMCRVIGVRLERVTDGAGADALDCVISTPRGDRRLRCDFSEVESMMTCISGLRSCCAPDA